MKSSTYTSYRTLFPFLLTAFMSLWLAMCSRDPVSGGHDVLEYEIRIGRSENTIQGSHEYIDVTLDKAAGELGGFDFLLAYEAAALNFIQATPGDFYDQCDWEYFTYRFMAPGYCILEPSHALLRVVCIAETNNGPYYPSCFLPDSLPAVLFTIDFLVTDDRTWECLFVPISFFWCDCGDNVMVSRPGDTLFISRFVYDSAGVDITQDDSLPTYFGAPSECLSDPHSRIRLIDFYNGGVEIFCVDPYIDITGDINLNGIAYEIADLILFTNYFIYGMAVFHINLDGQIAATDMNCDGIVLDIADLVYGVLVNQGDTLPCDSVANPSEFTATFVQVFETMTIEVITPDTLGAALLVFEGWAPFYSLSPNMEMKYDGFYGYNTRVLIYSLSGESFVQGPLLSYSGVPVLIEASAATYYGGKVETIMARGDVNLNGVSYEIADMVLFRNYFIYGIRVFTINVEGQIAQTDMNCDGITLDVADLVYGIRIVVGDAIHCDSLTPSPNVAKFVQDTATNTVEVVTPDTLGAAYMVIEGDVAPIYLHQQDMELIYAFNSDQNVTRILIYSLEGNSFVAGPLVSYSDEGVLIEASTATHEGARVESVIEIKVPTTNRVRPASELSESVQ